jgi:precorrin-8X/cobalt-precorrin-8 methylmutase
LASKDDNSSYQNQNSGTAVGRAMSQKAFDIENRSFEIIESEVGDHQYNENEWVIVRRVIHATADFDFADKGKIIFHKKAIESAFNALRERCTIVTDVDMVLAAINKKSIIDLGLKAVCYISDSMVAEQAHRLGKTRSETAMRRAAKDMDGGIVAIGNAPTALYEVISMVREGITKPAIVVGIPVGFVSAAESKEELAKMHNLPFITNVGRKGGSSAVSSIINAIMLLYQSKRSSA